MRNQQSTPQQAILLVPLFLVLLTVICGVTYLAGLLPLRQQEAPHTAEATLAVSPIATADGTPLARFGRLDPLLIEVVDFSASNYGSQRVAIPEILPVGIYLPRTGNTQFELSEPTPMPTPLPYPTPEPLPLPGLAELPQAAVVPTVEGPELAERALPYAGEGCAPSGNPVDGLLTQRFHRYHGGIDLGVPPGTPVLATHSGTVTFAGWSSIGYGYLVIVENGRFITYYAHNNSLNVVVGLQVGKGSILAFSGSTGNSSGPHVHYETRIDDVPVDPLSFDSYGFASC